MSLREAVQQALEALLIVRNNSSVSLHQLALISPAIDALRAALAEPVACNKSCAPGYCYCTSLQRKPLSGLDAERLIEQVIGSLPAAQRLIRAVERAHGIGGQDD